MTIPSEREINDAAQRIGLADANGVCKPTMRAAVAKMIAEGNIPGDQEQPEELHEVVIRFDQKLFNAKVDKTVRAHAVGAMVTALLSNGNIESVREN